MNDLDFENAVKKYHNLMMSFVMKFNIPNYDKDDLYQEALMVLHKTMTKFDKSKGVKFSTYLYTNLSNAFYDLLKNNVKHKVVVKDIDDNIFKDISSDYEDDEFYNTYKEDVVGIALEILKEMPRGDITIDLTINNMIQADVAAKYKVSQQVISKVNKRNLNYLKEELKKRMGVV